MTFSIYLNRRVLVMSSINDINPEDSEKFVLAAWMITKLSVCWFFRQRISPKYSDTSTPYHIVLQSEQYNLLPDVVSKNCWMSGKQCGLWWDAAFCGVSSRSTLFAQACLSKYIRKYGNIWKSNDSVSIYNVSKDLIKLYKYVHTDRGLYLPGM